MKIKLIVSFEPFGFVCLHTTMSLLKLTHLPLDAKTCNLEILQYLTFNLETTRLPVVPKPTIL
jgi:hypothetical protein